MNCDINVETIGPEIFVVTLPPAIVGEVWLMAEACRKIKEHPLAALKQHENRQVENAMRPDQGMKDVAKLWNGLF